MSTFRNTSKRVSSHRIYSEVKKEFDKVRARERQSKVIKRRLTEKKEEKEEDGKECEQTQEEEA